MRWNLALGSARRVVGLHRRARGVGRARRRGARVLAARARGRDARRRRAASTRRLDLLHRAAAWRRSRCSGVVQGAHWLLFFEAVEHGSVALAVLTFYAAPLLIALAAPFVLGERTSRVVLGACLVGALGIVAIALDGGEDGAVSLAAVAAGLGSAATYAVLVLLSKRLLSEAIPPLTVAFWDCLVGAVAVAPALLLAARVVPDGAGEWAAVLALGIVFTGASTLVYALLLRHVTAQAAGVLTFLEPVAGVLLAWAILEQRPGAATLVGGALVLAAGVAVVAPRARRGGGSLTSPAGVGSGPS